MRFCQENVDRAEKHWARDEWPYRDLNVDMPMLGPQKKWSGLLQTQCRRVRVGMGTNG